MTRVFFDRQALAPGPWKNGGVVARGISCHRSGSGISNPGWRIGVAGIAADAFSASDAMDFVIMLLQGSMRRKSEEGGIEHVTGRRNPAVRHARGKTGGTRRPETRIWRNGKTPAWSFASRATPAILITVQMAHQHI